MNSRPAPNDKDKKRFQRAMKLLNEEQPKEAIRLFNEVRRSWGDDPDIWYLLGLAHGKLGRMKDVEMASRNALAMKPDHFGALCNLANAQLAQGDKDGALESYHKSLQIKPDEPTVLDNYGRALAALGRHEEAIKCFSRILQQKPDYAPAHAALAKACVEGGQPERGFQEYHKALQIDSRLTEAYLGLGHLYTSLGDMPQATHHYREALRLQPALVDAYIGLGNVERHLGNFEAALEKFTEAEKISPDNPHALASKADTLQRLGDNEGAYKLLNKLNARNEMPAIGVETYSRLCQKFNVCDKAMELIELSLAAPGTDRMEKQMLRFSAGNLMDKLKRYDEAFEWFRKANETVNISYDRENQQNLIDQLIHCFSKEALATLPRAETRSTRPIFILGMPRSGSTLTEQILNSHPDVYGAGELTFINNITKEIYNAQPAAEGCWATRMGQLSGEQVSHLARRYLKDINNLNSDAKYVTDKMPHNFMAVGLINLLFPEARIIHCRRNALDNGLSIYFQSFLWSHNYATDLENIGHFYAEYRRLMQHWEEVIDIPMLTVDYENMIEDAETVSRRLLEFCGLEWRDEVMDFHKSARNVATASFDQVRQPIYKTSKARWKNYERHIEPLRKTLYERGITDI